MDGKTVLIDKSGAIGKLTFNRPEVLNAYSRAVSDELIQGLEELSENESTKVIVVTGSGKAFMAGADINMVNDWTTKDKEAVQRTMEEMFTPNLLETCPKPTIAAVNGLAFGMGCEIAMACDFRIASEFARFALPEIKLGLIPGAGGSQRLPLLVGAAKALEMISTGDPIDANEAARTGLVNQLVPADDLWNAVEAFANRLTDKSPSSLAVCKKLIYEGTSLPLYEGIEYERDRFCEIVLTEDAAEGTKAFIEKRKPNFMGK